jgi:DNA-binding YbaB/EbfC family protein
MKITNVGDLLKNIGKVRKDLEKIQADLKNRVVEAKAGGELVKVLVNGQQELLKLTIDPSALPAAPAGGGPPSRASLEMLEDLIVAAVSQGLEKSKTLKNEELEKATGGLGLNFADLF